MRKDEGFQGLMRHLESKYGTPFEGMVCWTEYTPPSESVRPLIARPLGYDTPAGPVGGHPPRHGGCCCGCRCGSAAPAPAPVVYVVPRCHRCGTDRLAPGAHYCFSCDYWRTFEQNIEESRAASRRWHENRRAESGK